MTTVALPDHVRSRAAGPSSPPRTLQGVRPFHASAPTSVRRRVDVAGTLPTWLAGELVRTPPAVFRTSTWEARHWFDGLGAIYAWELRDGKVFYRSRLLESDATRAALEGGPAPTTFDTPT